METSQQFGSTLPHPISATLQDDNPWWRGERLFGLPSLRRWAFDAVLKGIQHGLTPATVLRGPCQVGKMTLLNQVIDAFCEPDQQHTHGGAYDELSGGRVCLPIGMEYTFPGQKPE